ncbi:MAG TPA: hypothetical protein VEF34_13145 [Syntrophobacteraceae bacterium]|nr:hypothetical protein [Syntrophobacteraceae bacterium]
MNKEWNKFLESVPWFPRKRDIVEVGSVKPQGSWKPAGKDFQKLFAPMHDLLSEAKVTPVRINGRELMLFSWKRGEIHPSWLSPLPIRHEVQTVCREHAVLLQSFGGIIERGEDPDTWLMNHNDVLTIDEASRDAAFIEHYSWAFEDSGIPIPLKEYYSIAQEANGNTTLCNRATGRVILFAPDHAFSHIVPVLGCPEYTLYDIKGAETFVTWVNAIADQWLSAGRGGKD